MPQRFDKQPISTRSWTAKSPPETLPEKRIRTAKSESADLEPKTALILALPPERKRRCPGCYSALLEIGCSRTLRYPLLMFAKYSVGAQRAAPALARHLLCPKTTLYSAGINKNPQTAPEHVRSVTGVSRQPSIESKHPWTRRNTASRPGRRNTLTSGESHHPRSDVVKCRSRKPAAGGTGCGTFRTRVWRRLETSALILQLP